MTDMYMSTKQQIGEKVERAATIEVLNKGEKVLGSPPIGRYFVREYKNEEETGGAFYLRLEDADKHVANYLKGENDG